MLRTRGEGIQDNWDLWINASVFAYNTKVSSSIGVPVDWGVSDTFSREVNNLSVNARHVRRKTVWVFSVQKHERSTSGKSEAECADVQTVNPEHQSGVSSVVF